jgi:hypothetical protein|tara:strand:+ start:41 stop:457 length:417 start_codon:yes stop_codon:yes gene_type:complete
MGLPSSGQISINDIATEFNVSLSNVALNATLGTYASKASGATTAMSDFYGLSNLTAFAYNSEGQESASGACSLESIEETAYHNGSGTYPDVDDVVYSNSSGTTTLEANTYKYDNGGQSGGYMEVNEDGEVTNLGNCGK